MKKARFKIDENLPVEFAKILSDSNFDARTVYDEKLNGRFDKLIASACIKEKRVIVTDDLDFSDITAYPPEKFHGIIIFRTGSQGRVHLTNILKRLLPALKKEPLDKCLWIVDESGIRLREPEL